MIIKTDETVDLQTPTGSMRVHVFRPVQEERFPAVILYSEIYQVTAPIERLGAMIAGQGYIVAIPEVYHEYEPAGTALAYDKEGTDRGNDLKYTKPVSAFDSDTAAIIAWLQNNPLCTGSIGAFGVCLGGHLAYRAALHPDVRATACFYATDLHSATLGAGKSDDSLARAADIKGELMMVWGQSDPHVPYAGRRIIRDRLEEVGADLEWHEVNGQHAFLRDGAPRFDAALFLQAMNWTNALFQRALTRG
ncbi:dienelactone hydrolase family protein [Gluconobacter japonicus]|uniref:Carboxymethylenebutenolidase n=1 Tax=Gluconobacter japonicus TaxID=376620 RepID=A0ABQ5WG20_GLUJA|nr:dienelactone hydrolase family protein [Gluconobacter japonicus]KXV26120.1 dienelactone hydrolase [Gluconobacter japonicus]GBR23045.1 carboxymethylenebutenolidase [Gluconobacter japonicus NBRC 3271]GLQ58736.1 carboxymethylenebutenolidase [Gluconobacter japonicus]